MATSASENNLSLIELCKKIGVELIELEDWNCCGSSSAHSINADLALNLAARNLSLVIPERPLLVACPSCILRLKQAHLHLKNHEEARIQYKNLWGKPFNANLRIIHFFELLSKITFKKDFSSYSQKLKGFKFVPYYGCMLSRPPSLRHEKNFHGLMEKILASLGATPIQWSYGSRCCGTFLSVAKPDAVTPMINDIVSNAIKSKAECIVTACSMCHLNLEIRCNLKKQIPILHFSEILSLALGTNKYKGWFSKHIIDPSPLLKSIGLI